MYHFTKRILDILMSFISLIVLSPLLLFLALLVRTKLGSPIIFKQKRVGQYNKIFTLYKFRSMENMYQCNGDPECDELRMTKLGIFLRRTSLDELPQLLNIFLGHMSFIGPRPKQVFETLLMKETQFVYRTCIRPGLTSWSIINGRANLRADKALLYDLEHIKKESFFLDLQIIFKTIGVVINGSGITTEGYVTFKPINEFLIENNIKTLEEIEKLRLEAAAIVSRNTKLIIPGLTKKDFKEKRREIRQCDIKYITDQSIVWK